MTMSKPFSVSLPNRGSVRIAGPDAVAFLNGLVSNDVAKVTDNTLVYACLLTPQGKFLHDFFVRRDGDALVLDCEGDARTQDLHDRLLKFRLRAKIQISIQTERQVYALFNSDQGFKDPRHPDLGNRSYERPELEEQPFEIYDRLRLSLGVPDGSRDMELERSTLLECGIDKINGIDWDKGCYMGQELTARMHYRGLAKKHLHVVQIDGIVPVLFSDLPNGGSMRSSCGDLGLALLRDDTIGTFDYAPLKVIL